MLRYLMVLIIYFFGLNGHSQQQTKESFQIRNLSLDQIPTELSFEGELVVARSWYDVQGEYILILSRKAPLNASNISNEKSAELFGAQYVRSSKGYELLWDIYDFENNCPFDLWIGLLDNAIFITDLDYDGLSETTLIYKMSCRSDISPSRMKILMHEGNTKMGLRGWMLMTGNEFQAQDFEPNLSKIDMDHLDEYERTLALYGRYANENDFQNQPLIFLEFAKKQWLKFIPLDDFKQF